MNQTDTPLTDAFLASQAPFTRDDVRVYFAKLERDLAKANADKAVLVAACNAALNLAWEVGCETEDGVHTLLDDSRGDLYRKLSAALSQVQA